MVTNGEMKHMFLKMFSIIEAESNFTGSYKKRCMSLGFFIPVCLPYTSH